MSQPDLCIIICSINPQMAQEAVANFKQTAGIPLEIRIMDNRQQNLPIARIYNMGAAESHAPHLLFIHEDVRFETQGWGAEFVRKLSEPQTGVIGFAGAAWWFPSTGAWWSVPEKFHRCNYSQIENGERKSHLLPPSPEADFLPAVSLDGVAMAVRRDVWEQYPFDESVLKGFHCYDLDFSVEIARHYTNYVAYGIRLLHFSNGKYDSRWFEASDYIYRKKWMRQGAVSVMPVDKKDIKKYQSKFHYDYIFRSIRSDRPDKEIKQMMHEYMRNEGEDIRSADHTFALLWQYLTKRVLFPKPPCRRP